MFYIYAHYRPGEDRPFYVGKGSGRRAFGRTSRTDWWKNVVRKSGLKFPVVKFLSKNIEDEQTAFDLEKFWIALFGRKRVHEGGILINLSDGGEGTTGFEWSEEEKSRRSIVTGARPVQLIHEDGRTETVQNRNKFSKEHNISNLSKLLNGEYVQASGWQLVHPLRPLRKATKGILPVCLKNDFSKEVRTVLIRRQFCREFGLDIGALTKVIKGKAPHHKGWRLIPSELNNSNYQGI